MRDLDVTHLRIKFQVHNIILTLRSMAPKFNGFIRHQFHMISIYSQSHLDGFKIKKKSVGGKDTGKRDNHISQYTIPYILSCVEDITHDP